MQDESHQPAAPRGVTIPSKAWAMPRPSRSYGTASVGDPGRARRDRIMNVVAIMLATVGTICGGILLAWAYAPK